MTQPAVLVAGRYRLEERIGAGAMGVVWRAVDERLGRAVAVKQMVVPPVLDDTAADEAKQRIMREARIAARLHHPNAVAVFDVADHDGRPWLVMEYLPSRSLAAVLADRGPLPPLEVAAIGRQLADALAAAHAAGIVHRDVKPGNVLLGEDGTAKLTDFGISHAADDVTVTRTGMLAGTPAYLAPEVARGAFPTAASDVFAFGSTLYTAVEGVPPFGLNDNALALLHLVAAGQVRPPRQAGPLSPLLTQLLRTDPAQRPTMAHVRGLLAKVAAGRSVEPKAWPVPPSPPSRPASPSRPSRPSPPAQVAAPQATRVGMPAIQPAPARQRVPVRMLAVVGLLLLLTGALAFAALRERGRPAAGSNTPPTLTTSAPVSPPSTRVSVTSAPPTLSAPNSAELQQSVMRYYGLLPDDPERAWPLLGPGLRRQGFDDYERFWSQFESVQAQVLHADPEAMTVRVVLVFRRDNKRPAAELHDLTMIQARDGQLLIDRDRRLGATRVPGNSGGDGRGGDGGGDGGGNSNGGGQGRSGNG